MIEIRKGDTQADIEQRAGLKPGALNGINLDWPPAERQAKWRAECHAKKIKVLLLVDAFTNGGANRMAILAMDEASAESACAGENYDDHKIAARDALEALEWADSPEHMDMARTQPVAFVAAQEREKSKRPKLRLTSSRDECLHCKPVKIDKPKFRS